MLQDATALAVPIVPDSLGLNMPGRELGLKPQRCAAKGLWAEAGISSKSAVLGKYIGSLAAHNVDRFRDFIHGVASWTTSIFTFPLSLIFS